MKPFNQMARVLFFAIAAGCLAACGGGGSGDSEGPPVNPPSNPPDLEPTLVLSSTQMSAQARNTDAVMVRTISVSVSNAVAAVYFGGTYSGNGIQTAQLTVSGISATLLVKFKDPALMAPGTYNDTISVRACNEDPCLTQIKGSPQSITVTYTVNKVAVDTAVTFTGSQVAAAASNQAPSAPELKDESIRFTVTDPVPALWARTTVAGGDAVVVNAVALYPLATSPINGRVELTMRPAVSMGAGTYTENVKVEFCLDTQCVNQAAGSPANIAVTYSVTGSAYPNISVSWRQALPSGADLVTAETRSPKVRLTLLPSTQVHDGIYVRHGNSATGLIANVVEVSRAHGSQTNSTSGEYDLVLKAPVTLGSGTFTDTMQFEACYDAACTAPVPNSRFTASVYITIAASEGVDFTRRVVPINGPLEAVWSPTSQRLYVSSSFGALHRLVQVDPVTLGVVQGPALGTASLQRLAITSDGGYLYAGSGSFVHRLALPGMTVDLSVPLGNFSASSPYVANDLRTIPGQPQSFVVARAWNGNHGGVFAYDNETPRPVSVPVNPAQTFEFARWLLPGATPDTFLSQSFGQSFPKVNNYEVLTLDANGIRVTSSTPSPYPFGTGRASRVGSKLYTLDGKVLDASDGALLSTLPGLGSTIPGALLADESRGRIYAWTQLNQKEVILVYDLATQTLLGNVPVYDGSFYTGGITIRSLAVWGSNGLALVDGERLTLLTGPMIAP